jgi:hypothetical protein
MVARDEPLLAGYARQLEAEAERVRFPANPCEIRRLPLDCHCDSGVNSQYRRGIAGILV